MNAIKKISAKTYLIIVTIIALIMRLLFVTKAAIWHDEGYSTMIVQHDFIDIIGRTMRDFHPPLYYLSLRAWQYIFGDSVLALRGFSILCGILTVIVFYLLMRKLFNETTARIAGFFVAIGPFAIRYSNEVRMYAMVALLVTLASYLLVTALEQKTKQTRWKWWLLYALSIIAALYTQYYAFFIVPVHIGYTWRKLGGLQQLVRNKYWWGAHLMVLVCYLPWVVVIKDQVTRVTNGFWIPAPTAETVPHTISQFLTYTSSSAAFTYEIITLHLIIFGLIAIYLKKKSLRAPVLFLAAWVVVPIVGVLLLSIKQPVYQDRYFTYASIAFYGLLAVIIMHLPYFISHHRTQSIAFSILTFVLASSLTSIAAQARHRMDTVGDYVSSHVKQDDTIVSAELYTYFDFSYYNRSSVPTKLLYKDTMTGYGETSLVYDKPEILVKHISDITSPRVWVIGKTGDHDYFTTEIPTHWKLVERKEAGDSVAQLYTIAE